MKRFPRGNVRESVEKLQWELTDRAENAKNNRFVTEQGLYVCIFFSLCGTKTSMLKELSQNQLFKSGKLVF